VVAARGYPGAYGKGDPIVLPAALPAATTILHAGTGRTPEGAWTAQGGRVLGVVAVAPTLRAAADRAYLACDQITWANKYYRRDIGARQLGRP
jgi:phosphoribosylamine--glycine ligase